MLEKSLDENENDFNLINLVIDYKERQREKALNKMQSKFKEKLVNVDPKERTGGMGTRIEIEPNGPPDDGADFSNNRVN